MSKIFSSNFIESNYFIQQFLRSKSICQNYIDKTVPYPRNRWIFFAILIFIFVIRIITTQGWYIVCYTLGIYLLNLFLGFLTPKFDPSLEQELNEESMEEGLQLKDDGQLQNENDEFKPFIRRLPEFKFWFNSMRATVICLFVSFWDIFDIPVFWPILLLYFLILFTLTMRKQIQHMIKYKYLPFDIGKAIYKKN